MVTQVTGKAECYVFKCPFLLLTVQILFKLHLRLQKLFCLQTCSFAILSTNISTVSLPGTARPRASPSNHHLEELVSKLSSLVFYTFKNTILPKGTKPAGGHLGWERKPSGVGLRIGIIILVLSTSLASAAQVSTFLLLLSWISHHHHFLLPKAKLEAGRAGEQSRTQQSRFQQVLLPAGVRLRASEGHFLFSFYKMNCFVKTIILQRLANDKKIKIHPQKQHQ